MAQLVDEMGIPATGRVRGAAKPTNFRLIVELGGRFGISALRRSKVIEATTDGFRIAEEDLAIRGSGDFPRHPAVGNPAVPGGRHHSGRRVSSLRTQGSERFPGFSGGRNGRGTANPRSRPGDLGRALRIDGERVRGSASPSGEDAGGKGPPVFRPNTVALSIFYAYDGSPAAKEVSGWHGSWRPFLEVRVCRTI